MHGVWHGAWCMVYGAWCMVYGEWCMVHGMLHGARCMVHGMVYGMVQGMSSQLSLGLENFPSSFCLWEAALSIVDHSGASLFRGQA